MKKVLMVGLVIVLALAIFAGCAPQQPMQGDPPRRPRETTGGEEKPEVVAQLEYVKEITLLHAEKDGATDEEMVEAKEMKVPEGAKVVIVKIAKDEKMPKDVVLEIGLLKKGEKEPEIIATQELKTDDVIAKESGLVMLQNKGEAFVAGDYMIEVKDKKDNKKNIYEFVVEGKEKEAGEVKDGEATKDEMKDETKGEVKDETKGEVKEEVKKDEVKKDDAKKIDAKKVEKAPVTEKVEKPSSK